MSRGLDQCKHGLHYMDCSTCEPRPTDKEKPLKEVDPIVTRNERTKKRLRDALTTPCPCCHQKLDITSVAKQAGLNKSMLWKFLHRPRATMMDLNLEKVEGWLEWHDHSVQAMKAQVYDQGITRKKKK